MSKFGAPGRTATMPQPITGVDALADLTHEGGLGFEKDPKTALYTLAVTSLVEPTFYESQSDGLKRLRQLTAEVTRDDPAWVRAFVPWLRDTANMRSAAIVVAAEYAAAGGEKRRGVVSSAIRRADEPAEMLGYWMTNYGRNLPAGVKRGIADAARRVYSEFSALKYDGHGRPIRFADVIELTHPKPNDETQSALFRWLLDRRHGRDDTDLSLLPDVATDRNLMEMPAELRRAHLDEAVDAGWSWERLAGWVPDGMDAAVWEAVIPKMGYMALLRNLRNFEQAKVSDPVLNAVGERIADPEAVAKSRQFPYRFYSAYKASGSVRFAHPLEQAMERSVENVPLLSGRTLVMIDTSGSMQSAVSGKSAVRAVDLACLFGTALWFRNPGGVDPVVYATDSAPFKPTGVSLMRNIEKMDSEIGRVGHGTETWPHTLHHYNGHDRIVILSDMQDHPISGPVYRGGRYVEQRVPDMPDVPIYVFDLSGYRTANIRPTGGRYLFAGFTDAHFRLIPLIEQGKRDAWPWETTND